MESLLEQIIPILIALITAIIAYYKNKEANAAAAETQNVQDFFDPASSVTTAPASTPTRSYLMSDSVQNYLVSGETLADQATMIQQIDAAEAAGKIKYTISYSKGYYLIEYGQIRGGAKGE